jgi:multisubunit Na+/H+ antiporter MnhE subunit
VITLLLRAAPLTAVYLLVLTSVAPGDIAAGGVIGLAVAAVLRPAARPGGPAAPGRERIIAAAVVAVRTTVEMARGSWRTARFCLGSPARPGLVEVPRSGRSDRGVALWGVLTGEAPDEVPVDVDDERDVLIVHLIDAGDPDAVRERHREALERWQRKVVP